MANKLAENPFNIDTPSATVLFATPINIVQFELIDYVLDTDQVEVKNQNGITVWKANGASDLSPVRSGNIGWVNGLAVPTLTAGGGRLLVWFR